VGFAYSIEDAKMAAALTEPMQTSRLEERKLARTIQYLNGVMTFHLEGSDTDGKLALVEAYSRAGSEPPLHVHQFEDEVFYVLEGQLTVFCGEDERVLRPGEAGFLPRGIPHTFRVDTPTARALIYITPAGFEQFFKSMGTPANSFELPEPATPDVEKIVRTAQEFGIKFFK
jgi:quercetin dioxygenase-like cupin family protein